MPGNFTGRYWGKFGAAALPSVCPVALDVTHREAVTVARWMRKIVAYNVNATRWKQALKRPFFNEAHGWTRTAVQQALHGGKHRILTVVKRGFELNETLIPAGAEYWSTPYRPPPQLWRPPRKYKLRAGCSVRLICDARAFADAFDRARARGLLSGGYAKPDLQTKEAWRRRESDRAERLAFPPPVISSDPATNILNAGVAAVWRPCRAGESDRIPEPAHDRQPVASRQNRLISCNTSPNISACPSPTTTKK